MPATNGKVVKQVVERFPFVADSALALRGQLRRRRRHAHIQRLNTPLGQQDRLAGHPVRLFDLGDLAVDVFRILPDPHRVGVPRDHIVILPDRQHLLGRRPHEAVAADDLVRHELAHRPEHVIGINADGVHGEVVEVPAHASLLFVALVAAQPAADLRHRRGRRRIGHERNFAERIRLLHENILKAVTTFRPPETAGGYAIYRSTPDGGARIN